MKKIPCLKCGGTVSVLFEKRLSCDICGIQYQLKRVKRLKRKLEKKCITCGVKFIDTHSGILNCSKSCSVKYRKKWFRKYNKNHQKMIKKSRAKYEKNKR